MNKSITGRADVVLNPGDTRGGVALVSHGINYVWTVFATFLSIALLFLSALLMTANQPPMQNSSGNNQFIYFLQAKKRAIAASYPRHRLMVFGGSSSMYGLRMGYFAKALNTDAVVNMGLHAGLGLSYMLNDAKRVLRPGDTAMLIIEYPLLIKTDDVDWTLADYITLHDTDYFYKLPLRQKLSVLEQLTISEYVSRLVNRIDPHPAYGGDLVDLLDGYGDIIANLPSSKNPARIAYLNSLNPSDPPDKDQISKGATPRRINPGRLREVSDFIAWCRSNNIKVIASYPPLLDFPVFRSEKWHDFFAGMARFYANEKVPTIGGPEDHLYPKEYFFDSDVHLNSNGSELMTKQMVKRLVELEKP